MVMCSCSSRENRQQVNLIIVQQIILMKFAVVLYSDISECRKLWYVINITMQHKRTLGGLSKRITSIAINICIPGTQRTVNKCMFDFTSQVYIIFHQFEKCSVTYIAITSDILLLSEPFNSLSNGYWRTSRSNVIRVPLSKSRTKIILMQFVCFLMEL